MDDKITVVLLMMAFIVVIIVVGYVVLKMSGYRKGKG